MNVHNHPPGDGPGLSGTCREQIVGECVLSGGLNLSSVDWGNSTTTHHRADTRGPCLACHTRYASRDEGAEVRDLSLPQIPGKLQIIMTMWIPGKGWLTTRRGITVCGPIAQQPRDQLDEESAIIEVKAGLRAMRHRLEKDPA